MLPKYNKVTDGYVKIACADGGGGGGGGGEGRTSVNLPCYN